MDIRSILSSKESYVRVLVFLVIGVILVVTGVRLWRDYFNPRKNQGYLALMTAWLLFVVGLWSLFYSVFLL